jgi:hypothetical protein
MEYSNIAFILRQDSYHSNAENGVRPAIIGRGYRVSMVNDYLSNDCATR